MEKMFALKPHDCSKTAPPSSNDPVYRLPSHSYKGLACFWVPWSNSEHDAMRGPKQRNPCQHVELFSGTAHLTLNLWVSNTNPCQQGLVSPVLVASLASAAPSGHGRVVILFSVCNCFFEFVVAFGLCSSHLCSWLCLLCSRCRACDFRLVSRSCLTSCSRSWPL